MARECFVVGCFWNFDLHLCVSAALVPETSSCQRVEFPDLNHAFAGRIGGSGTFGGNTRPDVVAANRWPLVCWRKFCGCGAQR